MDASESLLSYIGNHWLTQYIILFGILLLSWKLISRRVFAAYVKFSEKEILTYTRAARESLFKPLRREEGKQLKILEIGAAIGLNLQFYPEGAQLTALDMNPHMVKYFEENKLKYPHLIHKDFKVASCEDMECVEDNSVDVVVATSLLCSVNDVPKAVREIHRILVPGGKYYFMEHVRDRLGTWRSWAQLIMDITKVWSLLNSGCCISRNPIPTINKAFDSVSYKFGYFPRDWSKTKWTYVNLMFCCPNVIGQATKASQ